MRCLTALVAMTLYVVGIWATGYLPASIVFVWLMVTRHLASLMYISPRLLGLVIMTLCTIGAFSVSNSFYDVGLALASGLIGWMFAISGVPVVPIVLGMVMGDIFEGSLRQGVDDQRRIVPDLHRTTDFSGDAAARLPRDGLGTVETPGVEAKADGGPDGAKSVSRIQSPTGFQTDNMLLATR